MNTLRENTGIILWILVLSFGVIWTLQDSEVFDAVNQPGRNAAVVDGQAISNQEYQNAVRQQRTQLSQEVDGEIPSRTEEVARERAYQQLVNSQLLEMEMKRLGMSVTDSEVEDMVFGETPHPVIRQQFADSSGRINYELLRNMAANPQSTPRWLELEQFLRNQRGRQKMGTLIQSTVLISDQDVEEYYWRQNIEADAEYVARRYASVPDDSIQITESDLRTYYDENQEDFKQERTVSFEYVSLSKDPTAEDTAAVADDLQGFRKPFATAEDDSLFLAENASERSFSREYLNPADMETHVADSVFANAESGRIVGPVFGNGLGHLIKIRDVQPAGETYVHARHILLESSERNTQVADHLRSIRDSISGGAVGFSEMARRHSEDQSASKGGDLGWFARGTMDDAFERAAFNATPGEMIGPVRSQFGYHLITVEGRTSRAVQIADLAFDLSPSRTTLTEKESTLEDVAFYAEEGNFQDEARRQGLEVQEVQAEATQSNIPGIGQAPELASFMQSAEVGQISDVIEVTDKFLVGRATDITPEGYRPFDEVKAEIRPQVALQKKKDVLLRQMERAVRKHDFEQLPQALNTQMRSQSDVSFSLTTIPGVGDDPAFSGTVLGLEEGETSDAVEGENAAFVVRVTRMNEPDPLTDAQREKIRKKLLQQRRQAVFQQWIAALKEDANIIDQRREYGDGGPQSAPTSQNLF